ncbi:hypothetical protein [Methylophilus sp. 3sh_L]|uniref:hypothetical protein n=1 Tax=Methylophilus sp. 3sh_L TaxID=3377114 RepID=UPI00398F8648
MHRQGWTALKKTIFFWLGVMSVIGLCSLVQYQQYEEAALNLTQVNAQWQQRQKQIAYQQSFSSEIEAYLSQHKQWDKLGLMSPLNVAAWEQSLAEMQQGLDLSHLHYEFLPVTPCDPAQCLANAPMGQQANIKVMLSRLQLSWSVKHETDILAWLNALAHRYTGAIKVHHCVWAVTPPFVEIDAQCELHLFNFPDVLSNASALQP